MSTPAIVPLFYSTKNKKVINKAMEDSIELLIVNLQYIIEREYLLKAGSMFIGSRFNVNHITFMTYIVKQLAERAPHIFENHCYQTVKLIISTCLLIAVKLSEDIPWSNRFWSEVFDFEMEVVNKSEADIFFCYGIDFSPTIDEMLSYIAI